jgi:hypothetical protein
MQHLKLGPVIRPEDPARMMQQLGAIVRAIPIYGLRVTKNWEVIDEVVAQVIAWHSVARPALPLEDTILV